MHIIKEKVNLIGIMIVLAIINIPSVMGTAENPIMSYDFLYNEGVESYLQENWEKCIQNFEMALEDWHWWRSNIIRCRDKCSDDGSQDHQDDHFSSNLTEEEKFFERAIRSTLCLVKCKKAVFGSRMDRVAEGHIDDDFDIRKPYDYLQLCYYKLDRLKEAADAAATVLTEQPDHEIMTNNLKFYLAEGDIKADSVLNRELKEYGKLYIQGNGAYNDNDYAKTVTLMEKSLEMYYKADNDCRRLCENPFDQGWFPDFISSIANHYTFTLRCKRRCDWQLSNLYGERIPHFYASYFNYLQYSYYQVAEYKNACKAVASALHLVPKDEVQLRNKEYYLKGDDVTEDMFVPREEVVKHKQKLDYEEKLMDFIETNFIFLNDEVLEDVDDDDDDVQKKEGRTSQLMTPTNTSALDGDIETSKVILDSKNLVKEEL